MNFNWLNYYTFAQEIFTLAPDSGIKEAYLRNVISRAYYSAFCSARNRLREEGIYFVPGGSVHTQVKLAFANSTDTTRQQIATKLLTLHNLRKAADYEDRMRKLPKSAKRALRLAQQILDDLAQV